MTRDILPGLVSAAFAVALVHCISFFMAWRHIPDVSGKDAAREVLSSGIVFIMTTGATFLCLQRAGSQMISGLGGCIVLAAIFSVVIVHVVMARLFFGKRSFHGNQSRIFEVMALLTDPKKASARMAFIVICAMAVAGALGVILNFGLHAHWLKWAFICLCGLFLTLFFYFGSFLLPLMALSPVALAAAGTLGAFHLFGASFQPVSGLCLALAMGLGVYFPVSYIRSRMRYGMQARRECAAVQNAMGIQAAVLFAGFIPLFFAGDQTGRQAGIIIPLVMAFSFVCAFALLPFLLNRWFDGLLKFSGLPDPILRAIGRYRVMEGYPRTFSRFKLRLDNMFRELPEILALSMDIHTIIDIGCGYGIPASWCLERYPCARVYGIDPDRVRVRVANLAWNGRGVATVGSAPNAPAVPSPADLAFMLDMIHFITDAELGRILKRLHGALRTDGLLVIRAVAPLKRGRSWMWRVARFNHHLFRIRPHYRSVADITVFIRGSGFILEKTATSGSAGELNWFIARASKTAGPSAS